MKNNIIIVLLVAGLAIIVTDMVTTDSPEEVSVITQSNGIEIVLHKSPTCGCCGEYGKYLENLGYTVDVQETTDMQSLKEELKIPYELESCHTSEVAGYVVEGHVPEDAIAKLIEDKPDIKGIGMAGMPSGSPGMPGPKEAFNIYSINHDGTQGGLFVTL